MADPKPSDRDTAPIIYEMADLLAQQKLVPFFGAGISRPHLGFGAEGLAREMSARIGVSPATLLSEVSDAFIDKLGEDAFVEFLKNPGRLDTLTQWRQDAGVQQWAKGGLA